MTKTKKIRCKGCEEEFRATEFEETATYANILGDLICEGCIELEHERPSTLIKWNGKKEVIHWGDYMAWTEDGDDPPAWFWELLGKNRREWHSTDSWRGYYETKLNGLVSLVEGWVTDFPDETTADKARAGNLLVMLNNDRDPLPGELFWLFEPTSNVFSIASEILVKEEDRKAIVGWLKKHGYSIEDLEVAFS